MEESRTRICAYCHHEKQWLWTRKKLKDGSKIYADESGKRWSGKRCPDCERARVQAALRCDSFERAIIAQQLEDSGYRVVSSSLPIKVQEGEKILTVGIRRASTRGGVITVEQADESAVDIYALVFESVRICTADQMERLRTKVSTYDRTGASSGLRPQESSPTQSS